MTSCGKLCAISDAWLNLAILERWYAIFTSDVKQVAEFREKLKAAIKKSPLFHQAMQKVKDKNEYGTTYIVGPVSVLAMGPDRCMIIGAGGS